PYSNQRKENGITKAPSKPEGFSNPPAGNPGITAKSNEQPETKASGLAFLPNCSIRTTSAPPSVPPLRYNNT
ncbi:hypothetical protein, partial [Gluconobacter kondonii]|uniref:hypothetical protein n=1 Tax=Gluconobacter kondonii TaxID=941463 RepID=UPI0024B1A187